MLDVLTCILGTFGFCVILRVPKNKMLTACIGGAISAVASVTLLSRGAGIFFATLISMLAITVYSEIAARIAKAPANIILLPSTIPLLPGGSLYYMMSSLVNYNQDRFIYYAKETFLAGAGIALGAVFVSIPLAIIDSMKSNKA